MGVKKSESHVVQVNQTLTAIRKTTSACGRSESYSELRDNAQDLIRLAQQLEQIAVKAGIERFREPH
jgi:hypothetical protein